LKEAIRNNNNRNELKLKLLEIYFTTKDKDAFEAQAEGLYASLGGKEDELWAQAVEMGREISPEHPLFAEASGVTPSLGAGIAAGGAATASGIIAEADEKFGLDKASSALGDEFSFDLSDEDLAKGLDIPFPEESEIGAGSVLDLDTAEGELESLSLDDADFAASGDLEELSVANEFSLDDDLSTVNEGEQLDLGTLDKFDASGAGTNDLFNLDDGLSDGNGLDDLYQVGDVAKGSSDTWTIAPAISSFDSYGVKGEMDDGYVPITNVATDAVSDSNLDHLSLDDSDLDLGSDLEGNIFDGSDDIVGTKLDLARAYIDMGDQRGARSILDEVVKEGDDSHRQEAEQLMRQIS